MSASKAVLALLNERILSRKSISVLVALMRANILAVTDRGSILKSKALQVLQQCESLRTEGIQNLVKFFEIHSVAVWALPAHVVQSALCGAQNAATQMILCDSNRVPNVIGHQYGN